MSGVAEIKYEYVYLTDPGVAPNSNVTPPQSVLDQYQFMFAQGIMNGYGSYSYTLTNTTTIPALRIPNGATVFLAADNQDTGGILAGLYIANSTATVPFAPGQTPTRTNRGYGCVGGSTITVPAEWNSASQNAADTNVSSVQLCTFGLVGGNWVVRNQQGSADASLVTTLTGKVFWYY